MIEYSGFTIDPVTFQIYKNGREVKFPQSYCLESAKATIDASNKFKPSIGYYSVSSLLDEDEHREQDQQDFDDRVNNYFESLNEPGL